MKVAFAVQGRFHAFDLARGLLALGDDVTVFTNYPGYAAERFGLPRERVRSLVAHGVAQRLADRVPGGRSAEPSLHRWFGRWACRQLRGTSYDVVHSWSGVSEELLRTRPTQGAVYTLLRGSAHIVTQQRILQEEEQRAGVRLDKPSAWRVAREQREYALADGIITLSAFAQDSFMQEGIPAARVAVAPLAFNFDPFRPSRETVEGRRERMLSGARLRVLYVGQVSYQKGLYDLATIARELDGSFEFRCVGRVLPEAKRLAHEMRPHVEFAGSRPQAELPRHYAWGDVFVFPSLQDGFAQVLAQARSAALPILTTTNCAGPELVEQGKTGWVLPIRDSEGFASRLRWCDEHRKELAGMVERMHTSPAPRGWDDAARSWQAAVERFSHRAAQAVAQ